MSRVPLSAWVVVGVAGLIVLGVAGQLFRGYRSERYEVAVRPRTIATPADLAALGVESWAIPSSVGDIHGWFIAPRGGATIVLAHGTQADRTSMLYEIRALLAGGHGIVAIDFPGLGESTGAVQMTAGRVVAMRAVFDTLVRRRDVDSSRLGLYGFSFGGATVLQFAAGEPRARAIIAAGAPFDYATHVRYSYQRNGALFAAGALLVYRCSARSVSAMNLTEAARHIAPRPALIVNGDRDRDVPPTDGDSIAALIGPSATRWLIAGAGHGEYWNTDPDYAARIVQFFSTQLPPAARDSTTTR